MYMKAGSIFIVAVSQGNANTAVAFQFLTSLVQIIKAYCGNDVNNDTIKNNFVLLYEVLDEVLDYGFPQNTTIDLLKGFITQQGEAVVSDRLPTPSNITIQATGAISWRKEGIKYRKNELFIDVVEQCNLMVSNKGTVLRNDVSGAIMVKCYLSGMPECKFGLNDKLLLDNEAKNNRNKVRALPAHTLSARSLPADSLAQNERVRCAASRREPSRLRRGRAVVALVRSPLPAIHLARTHVRPPAEQNRRTGAGIEIDDCSFHQCVKLGKFDQDRTVSFVPPDGEFQLMSYRITEGINLPFRVLPVITELGRTRIEINVKVRALATGQLARSSPVAELCCFERRRVSGLRATTAERALRAPFTVRAPAGQIDVHV
jgi:AP-2 complex subunit mu-1